MSRADGKSLLACADGRGGRLAVLALLVAGIVSVSTWSDVVGYSSTLIPSHDVAEAQSISSAYSFGRLFISAAFIMVPLLFERNVGWLMLVESVALLFCTSEITLYPSAGAEAETFSLVTAFLGGIAGTLMTTPLFLLLSRYATPRQAACSISFSLIGESVVSVTLSLVASPVVQTVSCCLMPLLGLGCCMAAKRILSSCSEVRGAYGPPVSSKFGCVVLLGELTLAIVAAALLRSLGSWGAWGVQRENYLGIGPGEWPTLLVICALVALITFLFFLLPKHVPNQARCLTALLVCVASLQVIVVAGGGQIPPALEAVPSAAQLVCRMLQWIIFLECVNRLDISPYRIHGIASVCNAAISLLLSVASRAGVSPTVICMAFMYLALAASVVLTVRFMGMQPDGGAGLEAAAQKASSLDGKTMAHLAEIRDGCGLSKREFEVMRLLVEGYTRPQIESSLGLSEGTVRTHMNNVYRKCGIHSRADLDDLVKAAHGHETANPYGRS